MNWTLIIITIIISNWGFGHLFTAIADWSVSFDGRLGYMENLPIIIWN